MTSKELLYVKTVADEKIMALSITVKKEREPQHLL